MPVHVAPFLTGCSPHKQGYSVERFFGDQPSVGVIAKQFSDCVDDGVPRSFAATRSGDNTRVSSHFGNRSLRVFFGA